MTTLEVEKLIYDAHVSIDPQLRSKEYYIDFYDAKSAAEGALEKSVAASSGKPFLSDVNASHIS